MATRTTTRSWRIGELAAATGLTVRTLRHYDDIGLLVPSERTSSGYRLYGPADVERLYGILALRQVGFRLEGIRAWLDGDGSDPGATARRHIAEVERRIALHERLRERLVGLLAGLERSERPSAQDLIEIAEAITMIERYYTPEQLEQLEARRRELGPDAIRAAEREWGELIEAVRAEKDKGTDPADARVQRLARRWNELIEQFTGGDPGIRASLQKMYEQEGPEKASRGAVDPELVAYVSSASSRARDT